jgi:hypothetical protein
MKHQHMTGLVCGARFGVGRRVRGVLAVTVPAVALAVALVGAAPADHALAQENTGAQINLGGSIADTVAGAVSSISTSSGGTVSGGVQSTHNEMSFGDDEGLAISDASGGNHNAGTTQK